jgi:hypothetical protein
MSNIYENNINIWGFDSDNIGLLKSNNKTEKKSSEEKTNKDNEQDVKIDEIKSSVSKNEELDKKQQEQLDNLKQKIPNINVEGNSLVIK